MAVLYTGKSIRAAYAIRDNFRGPNKLVVVREISNGRYATYIYDKHDVKPTHKPDEQKQIWENQMREELG